MYYYNPYLDYRRQEQAQMYGQMFESSIQPETLTSSLIVEGDCIQKWANIRLRNGIILNIFVTFITQKSIGGFRPNGHQIALYLSEIVEITC